jgi:cyclophilin family peptidyl-prolyl cis-trans isomerase
MATIVNGEITEVMFETNFGDITMELYPDEVPVTVANFLNYVNDGFYDGLIFHRVIAGFVIQGGGYDQDLNHIAPTYPPIVNESSNGLSNLRGTIGMARTVEPDSATSQFYINHADNQLLDYGDTHAGYCVFGRVIEGMNVVDIIAAVETYTLNDWPVNDVIIQNATVVPEPCSLILLSLGGLVLRRRRRA